ncbi:hypothetical protein GCM10028803_31380 [Larkinella knui]|uniref:DUF4062 domain-containing protein n=1 Tax=Larkinella knui TaxID=2025310 RepID=A0A3P1CXZ3_9BACT|nr:DUF4062 domain-containing protein [Larkinella knui]RRB18163.1 DUF4062 domain-containing protein [Larkinella knui]
MQKRYQVFVSSTFKDLEEEREEIMKVLLELNLFPAGMEIFPAADEDQIKYIHKIIDDSDYYILIIAGKYGSTNSEGISYTELEFNYALETKKPILAFVFQDIETLPGNKIESDINKRKKLLKFRQKVQTGRLTKYWKSKDDLAAKVSRSLAHAIENYPANGWIRSNITTQNAVIDNTEAKLVEKLIYYKFIHLSDESENNLPLYNKFVKRLDKTVGVFDEYITFRISRFTKDVNRFKSYDSTRGSAVEVNSLLPFVFSLRDTDVTVESNPKIIQPIIFGPSNVFVTSSHYYNGFQKGNRDTAVKADKDVEIVRLVVDFSSIVDFESYISDNPKVFYRFHDLEKRGKLVNSIVESATKIANGVYYAEMKDVSEGDVLRIEFASDY